MHILRESRKCMGRSTHPVEGRPGVQCFIWAKKGKSKLLFWLSSRYKGSEVGKYGAGSGASEQEPWAVRAGSDESRHSVKAKSQSSAVVEAAMGKEEGPRVERVR